MKHLMIALAACLLGAITWAQGPAPAKTQPPVDYNRDIRPILSRSCFACHGPDEGHRKAKLRVDRREDAIKDRASGPAIVPGKPSESEMIRRILADSDDERMPPKETGNPVSPAEVATLKRWIEQGARYAEHWAFVKPVRPPLPRVKNPSWPRNPIDYFILARIEAAGLTPNEEADRFALLRRASLDLRGLPPTLAEVDQFARDTSPDAYEKAVDRFLQDAAYGERWARMWLDLARYADSAGLGSDPLRPNMWRFRDWVIDAFNRNVPYDRFTLEQLAGDLLPNAAVPQKIATAFHRNTMTNTEGGTDDEEFRLAAVKDRVDTTMQVWMGLTMGCAKCHSHKYDPITHAEYYRFLAIFNQTADNDQPDERPLMPAPTPDIEEQIRKLDGQIASLRQRLEEPTPQLADAQARWEEALRPKSEWAVTKSVSLKSEGGATLRQLDDGSILVEGARPATDSYTITAQADLGGIVAFRLETIPDPSLPGKGAGRADDGNFVLSRFSVTAAPAGQQTAAINGRTVRVQIPGDGKILSLAEVQVFSKGENVARKGKASQSSTAFEGPPGLAIDGNTDGRYFDSKSVTHTNTEKDPWWEVTLPEARPIEQIVLWNRMDGGTHTRLVNFSVQILDDAKKVVWQQDVAEPPHPSKELSPSGRQSIKLKQAFADHEQASFPIANALMQKDETRSGWAVGPNIGQPHVATFVAASPIQITGPIELTFRLDHRYKDPHYTLGRFRLAVTNDPRLLERASVPPALLAALDIPREKRTKEQEQLLARHYRSIAPALQSVRDEIARLEKSRPAVPMLPVMQELPANQRRETSIHIKGNFLVKGDRVEPGVPSAFHTVKPSVAGASPAPAPISRLDVAKWLIDPENPLTARVAVNRFWAQLMGTGLVETEEDFGTQGELPSHPELLDWLAMEFVKPELRESESVVQAWDVKALLRLIVTSATYRQSSRVTQEKLATDPRNRLLARAPRFRLEAEMVRDQALALSGLLSRKVGGPSVYPYQPPGLWQAAFNGQRTWTTSTGEDRYRRGLYTFWRRTAPYPSMAAFDATSRETCTIRRVRTNTPLQAFVTLNDPVYVEAAQSLARRIVKEGGSNAEVRARHGLRLCLCRPPTESQVREIVSLYESEFAHYRKDPKAAMALATEPLGPLPDGADAAELAAWTVVANVLLNLDGVLVRG